MVVADFHVADRVKISTCSLLVLGGLFATFLSGGAGQGRRNSLAAYFLFTQARFREAGLFMVQRLRCSKQSVFFQKRAWVNSS